MGFWTNLIIIIILVLILAKLYGIGFFETVWTLLSWGVHGFGVLLGGH